MECVKCGRELKDKRSIERGYGPTCWKKAQEEAEKEKQSDS
ncbi:DUF6011 domain-containing protein [Sediminibacillus massiliensis]|nr:DUF6011 domain-containing protein [Sediminibacillus massiliensis]